jgi:hypothetical protein
MFSSYSIIYSQPFIGLLFGVELLATEWAELRDYLNKLAFAEQVNKRLDSQPQDPNPCRWLD